MDAAVLDLPDTIVRRFTGRSHWPPYSLRSFVGGAQDFESAGEWFRLELERLRLLERGTRILDVGCGCGRIAYPLATHKSLNEAELLYTGMDVDRRCVAWCRQHIETENPRFTFYHADCVNSSYNPKGSISASRFVFPHPDRSFDLILLTSVFTHLLEDDFRNYVSEVSRVLTPGGSAYASFFLFDAPEDLKRHNLRFGPVHGHCAVTEAGAGTNAVAFKQAFVLKVLCGAKLSVMGPTQFGFQDTILLSKEPDATELRTGWHDIEEQCWRWTEQRFSVCVRTSDGNRKAVRFRFHLPESLLRETGPIQLRASVCGEALPTCVYSTPGEHLYVQPTRETMKAGAIPIEFELDKAFSPTSDDPRQLGVQVRFSALTNSARRPTFPITIE